MISGVEYVSSVLARCGVFEQLYLQQSSDLSQTVQDSLVKLYIAVLIYLSRARQYYERSTIGKLRDSSVMYYSNEAI